jgi:hypothetical protein
MKTFLIATLVVMGIGAASPGISFAEEGGEDFDACSVNDECQNSKIDAAIAEQEREKEREEADRRIAQEDEDRAP